MHNLMARVKHSTNEIMTLAMPKESSSIHFSRLFLYRYWRGCLPDMYMLCFVLFSCDKSYVNLTSKTSHLFFNMFYDITNGKSVLAAPYSPV